MAKGEGRKLAVEKLETALKTDDESEKDFHVRQALQLIKLDGKHNVEMNDE